MKNLYRISLEGTFLFGMMALASTSLISAEQSTFTVEEIIAEDGHIKQMLTITTMIKDCTATQNTYATFVDCLAKKVGYIPNAPLTRTEDNVFARRQIRMLHSHCIKPLLAALDEGKYTASQPQAAIEERIIQCHKAIEALLVFLNKKEYDQK